MNSKLEICSFPDGKSAMLALTFDDGTLDHLEIAAPELEKRGWRGTFYINPQSNDRARSRWLNWDGIRELHRRGHEIGNHSMSHTNPQRLAQEKQFEALAWEITEAQRQIFEHTGARPVTAPKQSSEYTAPHLHRREHNSGGVREDSGTVDSARSLYGHHVPRSHARIRRLGACRLERILLFHARRVDESRE